LMRSVEE